jgi:hypothetical protein
MLIGSAFNGKIWALAGSHDRHRYGLTNCTSMKQKFLVKIKKRYLQLARTHVSRYHDSEDMLYIDDAIRMLEKWLSYAKRARKQRDMLGRVLSITAAKLKKDSNVKTSLTFLDSNQLAEQAYDTLSNCFMSNRYFVLYDANTGEPIFNPNVSTSGIDSDIDSLSAMFENEYSDIEAYRDYLGIDYGGDSDFCLEYQEIVEDYLENRSLRPTDGETGHHITIPMTEWCMPVVMVPSTSVKANWITRGCFEVEVPYYPIFGIDLTDFTTMMVRSPIPGLWINDVSWQMKNTLSKLSPNGEYVMAHPHSLSPMRHCFGSYSYMMIKALRCGDLDALNSLLTHWIGQYNPNGRYYDIEKIIYTYCISCGKKCYLEELLHCCECNTLLCDSCFDNDYSKNTCFKCEQKQSDKIQPIEVEEVIT